MLSVNKCFLSFNMPLNNSIHESIDKNDVCDDDVHSKVESDTGIVNSEVLGKGDDSEILATSSKTETETSSGKDDEGSSEIENKPGGKQIRKTDCNVKKTLVTAKDICPSENRVCTNQSDPSESISCFSWGEIPTENPIQFSGSEYSDIKPGSSASGEIFFSEDDFGGSHTSSSASSISSPAQALDDPDVEGDETTVEESEDERCATPPFPVLSSRPVKGESFCACYQNGSDSGNGLYCTCGEEDSVFEWVWEEKTKSSASFLKQDSREVLFHVDFSCGTAGVRGVKAMTEDQYYWEVKMTTPVYGTDMMVGVGTGEVDLNKYRHMFCSLLGKDEESWGLSYNGFLQHKSLRKPYSTRFGQGTIIGVHLDMWHGSISFFKNRKPLGVAYTGLQGKSIYPMVCSTAARSGMKVIRCCSFRTSLQFMCCQVLRKIIPRHCDVLEAIKLPPGLRTFLYNNVGWLLQPSPVESADTGREGSMYRKRNFSEMNDECKEVSSKRMRPSYRN